MFERLVIQTKWRRIVALSVATIVAVGIIWIALSDSATVKISPAPSLTSDELLDRFSAFGGVRAQTGDVPAPDSIDFLILVIKDAEARDSIPAQLSGQLSELVIERLIMPVTGETYQQVVSRLIDDFAPNSTDFLLLVIKDADARGSMSADIRQVFSDLIVKYLIMPATGEARDQVIFRLTVVDSSASALPTALISTESITDRTPTPTATPTLTPTATATRTPTAAANKWRGLTVAAEDRCSTYDSDDYRYSQSLEDKIVNGMGGRIYGPYSGHTFASKSDTDIEHIVARSEAHDSGLCAASTNVRRSFASDLLNLTLASPSVNRHQKSSKDAAEWLPAKNKCWFADRVVRVRKKYNLTIDRREANALERTLSGCSSVKMVFYAGASSSLTPTPAPTSKEPSALDLYDDNGNGKITCAEARNHGIAPVHKGHPAYPFMNDGDGDGEVCE